MLKTGLGSALALFDPGNKAWGYFSTAAWGIEQPNGLINIPGTTLMAVNGFLRGDCRV